MIILFLNQFIEITILEMIFNVILITQIQDQQDNIIRESIYYTK